MKTQSRIRLVVGVVSPLILFVSLVSFPLGREGWTTAAMFPDDENTFEFKNDETEDADDLHIEWGRAVTVKDVTPFKKKKGSGTNKTDLSNGVVKKTETASVTVTWQGTEPDVKKWWWTKGDVRLGTVKEGNPTTKTVPVTANLTTGNGLQIATFDIAAGRITVRLPDDIRAGDTISGTVTAEPKGQTPEERAKNMSTMGDQKIKIATAKKTDGTSDVNVEVPITATPSPFTCKLPPSSGGLGITLTSTGGTLSPGPTQTVPIELVSLSLQSVAPLTVVQLPTIGQTGRPIVITGPFDGKSSNTVFNFFQAPLIHQPDLVYEREIARNSSPLLAESPRKAVFEAPTNVTGPIEIKLKEGDVETKGTYRNVGVNLTAPKTNLLKGEKTELKVEVTGLQGLKVPVPLILECKGVITMVGGIYQPLVIQPSQVGADGRYTTTRGITGVQSGGWEATATVVTTRFNVCLQDDTAPARRILWNTVTGEYIFTYPEWWPPKGKQGGAGGTTGESGGGKTGGETGSTIPPADPNLPPTDPPGGLTGTGTMIRKGCIITLTHNAPDRRVFSRLDSCTTSGSSTIEDPKTKTKSTITDRNIADNTCQSK